MPNAEEQSKEAKRREYNRNAQRMFRQRRKEHIRNLERAERERISSQLEEIELLRQENLELRQENETLSKFGSSCSSPSLLSVGRPSHIGLHESSPLMTTAESVPGVYSGCLFPDAAAATTTSAAISPRSSLEDAPTPANRFCIVTPYDVRRVRTYLYSLFHPVLNLAVHGAYPDPQLHFFTLSRLAPSLPPSLKPTALQLQTPHNPRIDLIPSPTLRDTLLSVDAATASTFLTEVCTFACEIEDHGQVIIWGENFLNEFSWEFSATVLERWGGWILPSIWRERADFWRRQRGDPVLYSTWEDLV
ncbi:uncharacterized protein GIQ15_05527 [Arthroderma uncinatum]|uniref:uncharacterized protein n=1 Tax=Arthroderma uncinatum TaxID=74035 RepID=UPI00144A65E9|nr:uncharacterized protein GIQ15_05527 [Arthroderma uncinatum]KAF3480180.1 hypothetical protein GIQ15_05527 [Arthroderma uncinatum]